MRKENAVKSSFREMPRPIRTRVTYGFKNLNQPAVKRSRAQLLKIKSRNCNARGLLSHREGCKCVACVELFSKAETALRNQSSLILNDFKNFKAGEENDEQVGDGVNKNSLKIIISQNAKWPATYRSEMVQNAEALVGASGGNGVGGAFEENCALRHGNVVWGKLRGYPWWPGKIDFEIKSKPRHATLSWFGFDNEFVSQISNKNILDFKENFDKR